MQRKINARRHYEIVNQYSSAANLIRFLNSDRILRYASLCVRIRLSLIIARNARKPKPQTRNDYFFFRSFQSRFIIRFMKLASSCCRSNLIVSKSFMWSIEERKRKTQILRIYSRTFVYITAESKTSRNESGMEETHSLSNV